MMRTALAMVLAGAALLPAQATAARVPMKALIVHLQPSAIPSDISARDVAGRLEREGRRAQAPLLAALAELRREGHVRHVRSLWIADAVAVSADASAIAILQARPDVVSIEADSVLPIQPADATTGEPGIAASGAPSLWSNAIDGRGVTVATLDTGVDLTHPELASRYRGGSNSWFDPFGQHAEPVDVALPGHPAPGHGTQVMGVMVAGNGIGMAPGARFIAARVFDDAGNSTDSAVHAAFQWLLDPDLNPATNDAPNVVNASWGSPSTFCDPTFQPDLVALRAAHILPVFAAGNFGASDSTPANLPEAFAVGGLNGSAIASWSSIGPSDCNLGQYPALVAPGTGIRSTDRSAGFPTPQYQTGLQGTSFSAPHVAGALALLLQVAPLLGADDQARLLTQSAHDLGATGPDSTYGAGSLDVARAAQLLSPTLDFSPPVVSGATHADTTLRAHAAAVSTAIAAAEWWADVDPGIGRGQPMTAADGSFDTPGEDVVASTAALPPGLHVIGIRARDAGNWSAPVTLTIDVPPPPAPPAVVPLAPQVTGPSVLQLVLTSLRSRLQLVASDGFEHGLGAWPRRVGSVVATRAAAISGRRGMRATSTRGARAFVQRRLPLSSDRIELAFDLNLRTFSSAGAWIEIAAITSTSGRRLASIEVHSSRRGPALLRLSSRTGSRAISHSRPQSVRRQATALLLSLDATHARLAIDGVELGPLARPAHGPRAAGVVLGPWHGGPSSSTGYIDIDRTTVRIAPAS
jgi:subtilisin family serine protease